MKNLFNRATLIERTIMSMAFLILLAFCLYPFLVLAFKVFFPGASSEFTLKYLGSILDSKSTYTAITNTLLISFLVGLLSTILAVPLAWLFTRSDISGARKWRSLFSLPYAIPPYIGAMAWIYLANPTNGIINIIIDSSFFNIYTMSGLVWVMSSFFYTFILLSVASALDRMDPSLEEAARLSGANGLQVFLKITLPIILPALMSGVLLVILAAAASFGVPALIGSPAGIFLMTTKIYTLQKMGSLNGVYQAGALSIILLILAVIVLYFNQFILKKGYYKTVGGKSSRASLVNLGQYKYLVSIFLIVLFSLVFLIPLGGIIITALSKIQGKLSLNNLGFQNFSKIFFEVDETPRAFFNSFKLASIAATLSAFFGLILAYIKVKTSYKGRSSIEVFASLPYAAPGTVLAFAFILTFSSSFFGLPFSLYNTALLIGLAYFVKYLNFSLRTTADGLGQIDDVLAEAARVSGATWVTTMKKIWFPLLIPSLTASWFLVFMPAFSELTMTILLTGPGLETLGTLIFQLQEYADASGGGAAVLALITIAVVALINYLVKKFSKGRYGL